MGRCLRCVVSRRDVPGLIEALYYKDFQKHKRFLLELDPLVTILRGANGSGKSCLLRGLRWLAFNKPSGDSFIRHGAERAYVGARIDGHKIERAKGKGENWYKVDGQRKDALGVGGVPESVASLLNLSEDSFASQHATPYWFSLTAGQVSKELNRIVHLDVIDRTLASAAQEVKKAKSKVELTQERLDQAKKRKSSLAWIQEVNERLLELEVKEADLAQRHLELRRIDSILEEGGRLALTLRNSSRAILGAKKVLRAARKAHEAGEQVRKLDKLIDEITLAQEEACQKRRLAKQAEEKLHRLTKGRKCPLCGRVQ